ncbi:MAG: hypothetical protein ABMA13_19905 [Chthoniobacteraceae bacterium]
MYRILLVCFAVALCGFARKPKLSVRFHVEATNNAGGSFTIPSKFVNPPRDGFIEAVPFASEKNIVAIFPIEHANGGLGCAFQLNQSGALALRTVSTQRRGASVVGFISTKAGVHQLLDLPIDRPITDGVIYFPRGLSGGEIAELRKLYPLMEGKSSATPVPRTVQPVP